MEISTLNDAHGLGSWSPSTFEFSLLPGLLAVRVRFRDVFVSESVESFGQKRRITLLDLFPFGGLHHLPRGTINW